MPTSLFSSGRRIGLVAALLTLSAGAALAQATREQEEACAPDAVRLCAATIPDVPKTTACMKSHVADLSPRCRTMFNTAAAGSGTKVAAAKPAAVSAKPETRKAAALPRPAKREVAGDTRRETARKAAVVRPVAVRVVAVRADHRVVRTATFPARRRLEAAPPPEAAPAPVVVQASPPVVHSRVPELDKVAASIAQGCRQGLIDAFTCRNTFDALQITE